MPRFVAISLLYATAALGVYCLLVQVFHPAFSKAPSQYLNNRLFIEIYLYGQAPRDVLVGSSLTRRLPADALGPGSANIAISAGNALTGLEIALNGPHRPGRILFEINKIDEGLDQSFADEVFAQPLYSLRSHVMALRLTYEPMSVLFNLVRGTRPEGDPPIRPENIQRAIDVNQHLSAVRVADPQMAGIIITLRSLVARAEAEKMQVVFYEMPVSDALKDLPRPAQIRDAVRAAFPPQSSCWLYPAISGGAHTLDGLHLAAADARAVAGQLRAAPACNTSR